MSFSGNVLRLHCAYLDAPDPVLRAIVVFVQGRTRLQRTAARHELLAYKLPRDAGDAPQKRRSRERTHPDDELWAQQLTARHAALNSEKFAGVLRSVPIRISRRMKSRLGHYTWGSPGGNRAEIVISRRHIRRHGMNEAQHTLLHEMVHQWQDEMGHPVDHGRQFRDKARAVGIAASACRAVA